MKSFRTKTLAETNFFSSLFEQFETAHQSKLLGMLVLASEHLWGAICPWLRNQCDYFSSNFLFHRDQTGKWQHQPYQYTGESWYRCIHTCTFAHREILKIQGGHIVDKRPPFHAISFQSEYIHWRCHSLW